MSNAFTVKIDAQGVVRCFGNAIELSFALERYGLGKISTAAIGKWIERCRIPGDALLSLMILARILRVRFQPLAFVDRGNLSADVRRKLNKSPELKI